MYARSLAHPLAGNFAYKLTELPAYRGGGSGNPRPIPLFVQPFTTTILSNVTTQPIERVALSNTVLFYNGTTIAEQAPLSVSGATISLVNSTTVQIERETNYGIDALPVTQDFADMVDNIPALWGKTQNISGIVSAYISDGGATTHYTGSFTASIDFDVRSVYSLAITGAGGYSLNVVSDLDINSAGNSAFAGAMTGTGIDTATASGVLRGGLDDYLADQNQISGVVEFTGTNGDVGTIYFNSYSVMDSVDFSGAVSGLLDDGIEPLPASGTVSFTYDPVAQTITNALIANFGGGTGYTLDIGNITINDDGEWSGDVSDGGGVFGSANGQIAGNESTISFTFNDSGAVTGEGSGTLNAVYPEIKAAYTVVQLPTRLIESAQRLIADFGNESRIYPTIETIVPERTMILVNGVSTTVQDDLNKALPIVTFDYFGDPQNKLDCYAEEAGGGLKVAVDVLQLREEVINFSKPSVISEPSAGETVHEFELVPLDPSVNPANTILTFCGQVGVGEADPSQAHCMVYLNDEGTKIIGERGASGSNWAYGWQLFEFNGGIARVQRGRTTIPSGESSAVTTIATVNRSTSWINYLNFKTTQTSVEPHTYLPRLELTSDTELTVSRGVADSSEVTVSWEIIEAAPVTRANSISTLNLGGINALANITSTQSISTLNLPGINQASTIYDFLAPGLLSLFVPRRGTVQGTYGYSTAAGITGSGTEGSNIITTSSDASGLVGERYVIQFGSIEYDVADVSPTEITLGTNLPQDYTDEPVGIPTGTASGIYGLASAYPFPALVLTQGDPSDQPIGANLFTSTINGLIQFGAENQHLELPPEMYTQIGAVDTTTIYVTQALSGVSDARIASMNSPENFEYLIRYSNVTGGEGVLVRCHSNSFDQIFSAPFDITSPAIIAVRNTATTVSVAVNDISTLVTGAGSHLTGITQGQLGGGLSGSNFFARFDYLRAFSDDELAAMMRTLSLLI